MWKTNKMEKVTSNITKFEKELLTSLGIRKIHEGFN